VQPSLNRFLWAKSIKVSILLSFSLIGSP
jgi:hypothetical protein